MSANISLFSGYNQRENRHTNYCLLLLRLLYEEDPGFLEASLDSITGGQMGTIGVEFAQQQRQTAGGIPDGVISQSPFTIFIETKNFDRFYDDQLEQHLHDLNSGYMGQKILLALSKFEEGHEGKFSHIKDLCTEEYKGEIAFAALSFEQFLEAVRVNDPPERLKEFVSELETYFDQQDLLPSWKHTLDLCNCVRTLQEQTGHDVYICPAQGGSYSHKRCRYFGAYENKQARYIAEIAGVVDVSPGHDGETEVLWNNRRDLYEDKQLAKEARRRKMAARPNISYDARTFVLEDITPSSFRKTTKGGMISSKRYFDISDAEPESAPDLAKKLSGEVWADFE